MSGHSKWATTKRAKAAVDAKRGAIFTKLSKIIAVSAREKGADPSTNFSLRMAIDKARAANMPKENVERAIKRGTGELAGDAIEELVYEGIGPAKSQFIVKTLTDNKNRSAAAVRHLFSKYGGSLASVAWNFETKGVVRVASDKLAEKDAKLKILAQAGTFEYADNETGENLELELIDAGAQDIIREEEGLTVYSDVADLQKVSKFFDDNNIETDSADIEYVAKETQVLEGSEREAVEKFMEDLDDDEDVAGYYTNIDI